MSTISASTTSTTAYKVTADTTGTLVFQTGASPTTAMTLGSDQSVTFAGTPTYSGGTANGVAYLNGSKVLTTGTALVFDGTNLGVGATGNLSNLTVNSGNNNSATSYVVFNTQNTNKNGLLISNWTGSATSYGPRISFDNSGRGGFTIGGSDGANNFDICQTWGTPQLRIDTNGKVLAGVTGAVNSAHTFSVEQSNSAFIILNTGSGGPYGLQVRYSAVDPNNASSSYLEIYNAFSGALRAEIRSNGGLANYQGNNANLSDRREKTNFAPAGEYLAKICAIPVQTFNYIDQNLEEDGGLTLGVVAQDVQAVAPELVMESNWAGKDEEPKMRLSIYQTDLQYALMKCIQEQQAIIENLTNRIQSLENK